MSLPALAVNADTRSITDRINVLIRDYNNPPSPVAPQRYVPAGTVLPFAGGIAPSGFLLCYGQAVSRTGYAGLFAAIGTTHGAGDGSTTFNLPDLRGRAAFGKDDMGGSAASRLTAAGSGVAGATLGAAGGDERLQAHSHGVNDPSHSHPVLAGNSTPASYTYRAGQGDGNNQYYSNTNGAVTGISIQNAGAGGSQNVPPAAVLNFIIAT